MNIHHDSVQGKREQNEDNHKIIINYNGFDKSMHTMNLYSVFDGHGGKQISRIVSNILPLKLMNKCENDLSSKCVKKIHTDLQDYVSKNIKCCKETGSTSLNILHDVANKQLYVYNVGDSRCIICNNNIAIPLTKDHKPDYPEETRRISKLGGKVYFDGYDYRIGDLSVSRAFGDTSASPFVIAKPDVYKYKLSDKDKFLVIGCDGLYDVLSNQDIVNFILNYYDDDLCKLRPSKQKLNIASLIANYAIDKGSTDNISVIIVFLDSMCL